MFSLGEWSPQIPTGFHVSRGTWEPGPGSPSRFRLRGYHPLWRTFPDPSANGRFGNSPTSPQLVRPSPATPGRQRLRAITPTEFRLFPVRSPLLGESRLLSFPRGTEMFQFPRFASAAYGFSGGYASITSRGFPHSGIRGSVPACGFPRLIAACHALHRFLAPRHPPSALSSLTTDVSKTLWLLEDRVCGCQRADASPWTGSRRSHSHLGGDDRIRTGDPLLAKQVLSQLSYIPPYRWWA
jgi:hypothetical protein